MEHLPCKPGFADTSRKTVCCQVFQFHCSLTRKQEEENLFTLVGCTESFEMVMFLVKFLEMF